MKNIVEFKNFSPPARVNEMIRGSIARLERHAPEEESHDLEEALHAAFAEIDRQLEKHEETLKKSHLYKRPARRDEVRRAKAGVAPSDRER